MTISTPRATTFRGGDSRRAALVRNPSPGRIDLNTAPEDLLAALPMFGPARVEALLQRRPFRTWADVGRVPGISQCILEELRRSGAALSSAEPAARPGGTRGHVAGGVRAAT